MVNFVGTTMQRAALLFECVERVFPVSDRARERNQGEYGTFWYNLPVLLITA